MKTNRHILIGPFFFINQFVPFLSKQPLLATCGDYMEQNKKLFQSSKLNKTFRENVRFWDVLKYKF